MEAHLGEAPLKGLPGSHGGMLLDRHHSRSRAGILLDRDGTIIVDHGHVGSVDRVALIEGSPEAIAKFNQAGIPVAVVTNQAGVARGLYGIDDVALVHKYIAARLTEYGAHIDRLEHPARVGSWLATTARHECLRSLAARKKVVLVQDDMILNDVAAQQPDVDERLLADERAEAVRDALSHLPEQSQRLLELLMADPPVPYTEISDELGLPIGSIGPTRGRCLEKLRVLLQAS